MVNDSQSTPLDKVIAAYLKEEESGRRPDREEWICRYPQHAGELRDFFNDHDRFKSLAGRDKPPVADGTARIDLMKKPFVTKGGVVKKHGPIVKEHVADNKRFGDYELGDEIARGAMGIVYRARQVSLDRPVALKMMLETSFAHPDDVRRFRQEARAAGRLEHPNIVPIYDVGECNGRQYYTMRLIPCGDLSDVMSKLRKDPRRAARILITIARAVDHAHQKGILHRDLKPANILMDSDGIPHVADFGLAKRTDDPSTLTMSGQIMGTAAYMSPEQASGDTKRVTASSDVYSLGAIFYEMLTGEQTFSGDNVMEVLLKVRDDEPIHPTSRNPGIDRDMATICMKCLEKNPDRRYSSAEALARDLEAWLAGEPIAARAVTGPERAVKWIRRHPVPTVVVVMGLTLIMTAVLALQWRHDAGRKGDLFDMADTLAQRGNYALARQILDEAGKTANSAQETARIKAGLKSIDDLEEARWTMGGGLLKPLPGKKIQQGDDIGGQ